MTLASARVDSWMRNIRMIDTLPSGSAARVSKE
jgi:hypothetical protein